MITSPTYPETSPPHDLASDFSYFRELVLLNEAGVTEGQANEFKAIVESAKPPQSVDDLSLSMLRALAPLDNAHTTVLSPRMHRLPVRFHWTSDALIIVKARPEQSALVGQRVLSLGGKSPEELIANVPRLIGGGTQSWKRYRSEFLYSAPSALLLLGAQTDGAAVQLEVLSLDGLITETMLEADPVEMPGDPFWDFLDAFPEDSSFETDGWVNLLTADQPLPLYLQEAERTLFAKALPAEQAVYLRVNGSFDDKDETISHFGNRVLEMIAEANAQNIIVDFRYNRGGDYTQLLPLVSDLSEAVPSDGRLYLITGPNTFSAGLVAGSQFKHHIPDQLTIVGSEVGDVLRFKAEGFAPKLPASGVQLYITTAWGDVAKGCDWFDDCFLPNKLLVSGVGSMDIDLPIENTWRAFVDGEDLVLESIQSDILARQTPG
ncbi:hypothetical protein [uncultured Erythrobacter sp.]|uniref:hypothetical protein n=1 Tax=uncultured Erythrobacter sp. TaxID=263913 RepID=UPI00261B2F5B|nr:hypothetical protein [uncultured Erythrobacter sp.]